MMNPLYSKKTPRILLAVASDSERSMLREYLMAEGYQVAEARNGTEALAVYTDTGAEVVLVEAELPGLRGAEVCQRISDKGSGLVPAVFIMMDSEDEAAINGAISAGAADYIHKPVNRAVLGQRLKRAIMAQETAKVLDHNRAFSESVIGHAIEGIITLDGNRRIRYVNPAISRLFRYTENELMDSGIDLLIPSLDLNTLLPLEASGMEVGTPVECDGFDSVGNTVPVEMTVCRFPVEGNWYYTLTLRDITARIHYEEKIQYQAFYDALTGLPNRVFLKERMSYEIARSRRSGAKFALMYLDLDRFKLINDTLGHETGDLLLQEVAKRLKHAIRSDDLVARMGGDEFVVLLPNLFNVELVGKIATKILDTVKEPMLIEGRQLNLSISIGITIFPDDAQDHEMLLTYADVAMYRAKENGKDTFQTFTKELNAKAVERLDLENGLRQAVENDEFVVYYQPKVSTKSMAIVGMEALVRWQHPKLGLISPMSFIPVAEKTGLIVPIGAWVLKTACAQNQSLLDEGLPLLTIAVNLSMRQFEAQNMTETVMGILEETGLDPRYLELEITESIAMKNAGYTASVIQELQKSGIKFSIDDFGTGYSSLSHINSLAVDKLKIDKSFVSPIDGIKEHAVIASTVLSLGKSLNMQVIAEGVETQAQVDFFTDNNCDEMQGYYIAKPMTWENFKNLYRESLARHRAP